MPRSQHPPFDIIHVAHTPFPEDPRPRREAMVAAEGGRRVALIVAAGGRDPRPISRYGPLAVIRLPTPRRRGGFATYLLNYLDFLRRARRLIANDDRLRRARIVHVHTLPDFLVAAAAPARRRGARVILDLHEIFPEFTRTKFPGPAGALAGRLAAAVERWSRRQATVVVTVNAAVARLLRQRPAGNGERIAVVHNVTDPADFGPGGVTSGIIEPGPLRLVYHGTLTELYGLDIAVDIVAAARQRGLEVELDLYGEGPQQEALERRIAAAGLGPFVRLKGSAPHEQLRVLLPRYHAGLVPTRENGMTRYSLSTKLLEYVHLGLPVVATALPTYQEYFPPGTLWYFPGGSVDAAVEVLREFRAASPAERAERARRARAIVSERLSWESEAQVLRSIYEELLES